MKITKIFKEFRASLNVWKSTVFNPKSWDKSKALIPFQLFTHPLETFSDMKYERRSSLMVANVLAVLFFLVRLAGASSTAYLHSKTPANEVNVWIVLAQSIGIALLWTICCWAACTLFNGEGTAKEIWIATTYSFIPVIIIEPISILLSYLVAQDEAIIINTFQILSTVLMFVFIFLGMIIVQQFTVTKTALLAVVTILGIVALCFLFLLLFSVSQQLYSFISNIVLELTYR